MLEAVFLRRLLPALLALFLVVGTGPRSVAFAAGGVPEVAAGMATNHDHAHQRPVPDCPDCPNVGLCGIACGAVVRGAGCGRCP